MTRPLGLLAPLLLATAAALSSGDANADASIALGEVAVPPISSGVDHAALKNAAEGELSIVDASHVRRRRSVVVSVAVIGSTPSPFACTVNALIRDAKTGTMLAILEGHARAEGNVTEELRKRVLRAAMHGAVSQIPAALGAN